jgi:hypothetical protein
MAPGIDIRNRFNGGIEKAERKKNGSGKVVFYYGKRDIYFEPRFTVQVLSALNTMARNERHV